MATTRIIKDLIDLRQVPIPGVTITQDPRNALVVRVRYDLLNEPYDGTNPVLIMKMTYVLKAYIDTYRNDFPNKAPETYFEKEIYHINVEKDSHSICYPSFVKWQNNFELRDVIYEIQDLLNKPDLNGAVNETMAKEYTEKVSEFNKKVKVVAKVK